MAGTEFGYINSSNYSGRIYWCGSYSLLSQDPVANTSRLRLYGNLYLSNSYSAHYESYDATFKVNGTTIVSDYHYNYYTPDDNGYHQLGYTDITVAHNADGTFPSKTISLYADSYHFSSQSGSGTISGIATIDRNGASLTLSTSNITANGFTVTATTNVDCDNWEYRIGTSGNFQSFSTTVGKSATYTLSGSPATAYTVYIRAQRQSNHVTTTASTSATTLGYATIDSIANINTGSSAVVKFTPKATTFYYKVDFKLNGSTIRTETIGNVAQTTQYSYTTSYNFPVTLLPNSTSATITATLYTYTNSSYNVLVGTGQTKTFTLSVPSSVVPSIGNNFSVTPYSTNSWLSNKSFYVSGYSQIKIVAPVSAGTGATVSSVAVTGQSIYSSSSSSNTYTFYTNILTGSGSKSFTTTVTDSRGRTASRTDSVTYLAYSAPAVNAMSAQRGTYSGGTWTSDESGNHIRITASATGSLSSQGNTLTLTLTAKIGGIDTSPTAQSGNYYYWDTTTADQSYVITAEVVDLVGNTSTSSITVSSVSVPMNVNTVIPAIAFGKVAETSKAVEVASDWKLQARGKHNKFDYAPYSWDAVGTNGSSGYARIATITLSGASSDGMIQFTVRRRYDDYPVNLYVLFGTTADPTLSSFYYDMKPYAGGGTLFEAFIRKITTRVWDVYVRKVGQNDHITVTSYLSWYMQEKATITYADNLEPSVPSGATVATPIGGNKVYYGTSSTGASTVAKVATCPNMPLPLAEGTLVCIRFSNTNTGAVADLTLNVNSQGAKSIKIMRNGGVNNLPDTGALQANAPCMFAYINNYWFLVGYDYNSNTTYSAMTQSEANTGTATTARTITASVLSTTISNKITGTIKDYITERGTSGSWKYEKWNSGKAVCWCRYGYTVNSWSSWGSLYEGNPVQLTYPSGLFNAVPQLNVTVDSSSSGVFGPECYQAGTKDKTPTMYPLRPNDPGGSPTCYMNVIATGTWK